MPDEPRKHCEYKGRNGEMPCPHWALPGSRYCARHGGRVPPRPPLEVLEESLEQASRDLALWELVIKALEGADVDGA
jgi:hypothetical protein